MDDASHLAFIHGTHGQDQTSVTHRGLHIVVKDAVLLPLGDDAAHGTIDAVYHAGYADAQFLQPGRRRVLDIARLVEHMADGGTQVGK